MRSTRCLVVDHEIAVAAFQGILKVLTTINEWPFWGDCVEKGGVGRGIITRHDSWGAVDDGGEASPK